MIRNCSRHTRNWCSFRPTARARCCWISPVWSAAPIPTGGLDLSGDVITSNAFWGESSAGTWTLQVQDVNGNAIGTVQNWSLTVWGDSPSSGVNGAVTGDMPLIITPEFVQLAAADPARTVINPNGASGIDLIALTGTTSINLQGGAGMIDGVNVTIMPGLTSANASGSTGSVTLYGAGRLPADRRGRPNHDLRNGV